jgi:hypothetical protein
MPQIQVHLVDATLTVENAGGTAKPSDLDLDLGDPFLGETLLHTLLGRKEGSRKGKRGNRG